MGTYYRSYREIHHTRMTDINNQLVPCVRNIMLYNILQLITTRIQFLIQRHKLLSITCIQSIDKFEMINFKGRLFLSLQISYKHALFIIAQISQKFQINTLIWIVKVRDNYFLFTKSNDKKSNVKLAVFDVRIRFFLSLIKKTP